MSEPNLTEIEKYNPAFAIGRAVLGEEYKLDNDDYLETIKGTIGCIPVVGALATSCFTIFWKKAFPVEDPYLRKEDFEKRLKRLISDMEKKMDKKIDEEVGKPISDSVKSYMAANHVSFRNLLMECLIFFGREDKIELLIKLYLQTVVMYIAFLRDTHFCGIEWGLPEEYVYGVDHIRSMEYKIHDTIRLTHEHFSKFFNKVNETIISDFDQELPEIKGDYRTLTSQLTYADVSRYKYNQIWLQRTNEEGEDGDGSYYLPISNRIYIADFSKMGFMLGIFENCEEGENSVNSVTGTIGLLSGEARGLYYDTFYFMEPKNLTFRILGRTDSNAGLEIVIREIPEGQVGHGPDSSRAVATKTHIEKIPLKKLFESSSGPMSEFVSKPYKFEQTGSVYFEAKVIGGDTRDLYTLEIIDTQI
ncbi:hypothetical protein CYY_005292 [Polysphondylium violaceum]|uniref:Pesticidal crystal protein N-terminal domain-containing protein n=1 Tax=Polysphondylium violaceum TaxID=133409 RepID=A0A8J4V6Y9_9MYCE|nr:hypothetical protein CYY_005292 [Polysphondylium violaceum]